MENKEKVSTAAAKSSISFGMVLATVVSYVKWNSIFWAIIHGSLGWFYIIYYIIKYL